MLPDRSLTRQALICHFLHTDTIFRFQPWDGLTSSCTRFPADNIFTMPKYRSIEFLAGKQGGDDRLWDCIRRKLQPDHQEESTIPHY
jgi:hypothetical protein